MRKLVILLSFILFGLLTVLSEPARAQSPEEIESAVDRRILETALEGERRAILAQFLQEFYVVFDNTALWTDPINVEAALEAIADAESDGLNPEDFGYSRIAALRASGDKASLDVALTENVVLLAYTLALGKIDPASLSVGIDYRRAFSGDPIGALKRAVEERSLVQAIAAQRPRLLYYSSLRDALGSYRAMQRGGGWPAVSDGPTMRLGDSGPRVEEMTRRLAAEGLSDGVTQEFDPIVESAVRRFQEMHGLEADGIVGPSTVAEMNVNVEERIDQIRINMERARWIGGIAPDRQVLVNIAGFYASLVEDGNPVWTTRTIVGREYSQTPIFTDAIEYIEFNPTWTAPRSIIRNELAPKILADRSYLSAHGYYLANDAGDRINPTKVDWSSMTAKSFPFWVVQEPGPQNALGQVKFMFPNPHSVYLHDTPQRTLFDRAERSFSHGCIRTEDPLKLAELILAQQGWDRNRIDATVSSGKTFRVSLETPVPITILYWTVDPVGDTLRFYPDLYGRDPAVLAALNSPM